MIKNRHRSRKDSFVVLLSGGLDSSYNFVCAVSKGKVLKAITFDYGQKAAQAEIRTSRFLAKKYAVEHEVVELPFFKNLGHSSLTSHQSIPKGNAVKIDSYARSLKTAARVWVPNRNGVFLSVAASIAEGIEARSVVVGFNAEEAQTFPDNSAVYLDSMVNSWKFSTQTHVKAKCWSLNMNKTQILKKALRMGLDLSWFWPCYESGAKICGTCESCQRFLRAQRQSQ